MESPLQFLLVNTLSNDKQTLFQVSVLYNRKNDVEFLLKNFSSEIDIQANNNFALRHVAGQSNLEMLKIILLKGRSKTQCYINFLLRVSLFIPFLMENFFKSKLDKSFAEYLINVAIKGNVKATFQYLIEVDIQDFISDYKYVIVASGAGRNDILNQFSSTVKEVGDECIETAYLSNNINTVQFLLFTLKVNIVNKFLEEKIRETFSQLMIKFE